jgi:hypothetical protein
MMREIAKMRDMDGRLSPPYGQHWNMKEWPSHDVGVDELIMESPYEAKVTQLKKSRMPPLGPYLACSTFLASLLA